MKACRVLSLPLFLILICCSNGFADENPFSVKLRTRYMFSSDARGQDGDVEMAKLRLRIGYQKQLENNQLFWANIGPDHYIITEHLSSDLPAEAKSRGIRLGTELNMPFVEQDNYFLGFEINPTFQTTKGVAFDGDAFRFNFSAYVKYKTDNDFAWVLGANIRPEYDLVALPIFGFNYHVNDKLFIKHI